MKDIEEQAKLIAEQYRVRDFTREPLRKVVEGLLRQGYNMTQIARITDVKRTTLYYIMGGRDGWRSSEIESHLTQNDGSLSLHDGTSQFREVA